MSFWKFLCDPHQLFDRDNAQHIKVLESLRDSDLQRVDFDKKKVSNHANVTAVYSVKLNRAARMIFVVYQDKLILHSVYQSHDAYIRALRHDNFSEIYTRLDHSQSLESHKIHLKSQQAEAASAAVADEPIIFEPLVQHGDYYIELSGPQKETIKRQLPLVITGPAGCGKSITGFELLKKAALQQKTQAASLPIAYIGPQALLHEIQRLWKDACRKNSAFQDVIVHFHTLQDLVFILNPDYSDFVGFAEFSKWYLAIDNKILLEKLVRSAQLEKGLFNAVSIELIYRELKLCQAYGDDAYKELSAKRSRLEPRKRVFIVDLMEHYLEHLAQQHKCDINFANFSDVEISKQYELIFCDEAQSYPQEIVRALMVLCGNYFVAMLDTNQLLDDIESMRGEFVRMAKGNVIALDTVYRSPLRIAQLAQSLLVIKNKLVAGVSEQGQSARFVTDEDAEKGDVSWYKTLTEDLIGQSQEYLKQPGTVFVTFNKKDYSELVTLFGEGYVFKPEEIQGLSYTRVIIYNIQQVLSSIDRKIWTSLEQENSSDVQLKQHCSREPQRRHNYEEVLLQLNQLFVALTRSLDAVILVFGRSTELDRVLSLQWSYMIPYFECKKSNKTTLDKAKVSIVKPQLTDF